MARTVNKHIRIDEGIWERLEAAAKDHETTWPRTDVQTQVARSSLYDRGRT